MQTSKEYEILKHHLPRLQSEIATLNKRAAKIGCSPILIETVGERTETLIRPSQAYEQSGQIFKTGELEEVLIFVKIRVVGETPKFQGWTFAATIQHLPATQQSTAFDIIRAVPGMEIPTQYRDAKRSQVCDHCQTNRYRKDTFIVRHDDGTWKQVGRQCL